MEIAKKLIRRRTRAETFVNVKNTIGLRCVHLNAVDWPLNHCLHISFYEFHVSLHVCLEPVSTFWQHNWKLPEHDAFQVVQKRFSSWFWLAFNFRKVVPRQFSSVCENKSKTRLRLNFFSAVTYAWINNINYIRNLKRGKFRSGVARTGLDRLLRIPLPLTRDCFTVFLERLQNPLNLTLWSPS